MSQMDLDSILVTSVKRSCLLCGVKIVIVLVDLTESLHFSAVFHKSGKYL